VRNAAAGLSTRNTSDRPKTAKKTIDGQKRCLFRIAMQTSLCLLINVGVFMSTSVALEEWSRSSEIWLHCSTLETPVSKNYDDYKVKTSRFAFWAF
jgi:hypothetical protein